MDAWSPGYLAIAAQNHNGMLRMYEIFNQQGANTKKARFTGAQTTRQWYRPNPMTGEADWSIRNSINYSETAVLTALELTSKVPLMIVENFYKKSINAVNKGTNKAPYAFVIRAGQGDQTKVDRMANLLRVQAIEVSRHAEVKVKEGTFPPAPTSSSSISRTGRSPRRCSKSRCIPIRRSRRTTTAPGRWGWRTTSRSRRSRTRRFSMRRPRC
jgi:hypothetical protein